MLKDLCTYRALDGGCGLQTYISCTVNEGHLSLASYFGSEIYLLDYAVQGNQL